MSDKNTSAWPFAGEARDAMEGMPSGMSCRDDRVIETVASMLRNAYLLGTVHGPTRRPGRADGELATGHWPDFGEIRTQYRDIALTCQAIVPGKTLHDLVHIFTVAKKQASPADSLSGNPSKWPTVRGTKAVVEAVLRAVGKWE